MKRHERKCGKIGLIFVSILLLQAASCEVPNDAEEKKGNSGAISIMTWNVEALFDGVEDGNEYDEYRQSAGWSKDKYAGRLIAIARAITEMKTKPDIIAMQEIENERVMKDLAAALSIHGYKWSHFTNNPGMSLGVGILSRFPLEEANAHSSSIDGDVTPRPVLEARIKAGKGSLVLFVCHWKSKLGGDDNTESTRRAAARIILRRMREMAAQELALPVMVMGDLNENHDEFYRRGGDTICALIPDDFRSAEISGFSGIDQTDELLCAELQKDFIILSKNKPPTTRYFSEQAVAMYSPWNGELQNGSYYYKNEWETIDHFLLSAELFDKNGWEFDNCAVVDYPPFTTASGRPSGYNPRTGSGLSDHLPLQLFLKWQ